MANIPMGQSKARQQRCPRRRRLKAPRKRQTRAWPISTLQAIQLQAISTAGGHEHTHPFIHPRDGKRSVVAPPEGNRQPRPSAERKGLPAHLTCQRRRGVTRR